MITEALLRAVPSLLWRRPRSLRVHPMDAWSARCETEVQRVGGPKTPCTRSERARRGTVAVVERVKWAEQRVLWFTPRAPASYSPFRTEFRAASTLSPGIIRASFEHWSVVTSLHIVVNSPITDLRLPLRAAERRRETV